MSDSLVVEPVVQPAPPPHPKTNWWKLATIFLTFLLIGGGLYTLSSKKTSSPTAPVSIQVSTNPSPSSDPTTNWKTYASREYTYSFRVPTSWTTTEENGQLESKLSTSGKISMLTTKGEGGTISIFFEGEFDHGLEPWNVEATENITIGQTPATKNTFSLTGNPNKWVIITIDSLHNFRIEIQGSKGFMETADQILSTFKLTDLSNDVDDINNFVVQYMDSIINKDWQTVKNLLSPGVKDQFDQNIVSSYSITRYEILSVKPDSSKQNYSVTVRMYDSAGNIKKTPIGDPILLITKDESDWKILTWYFFQ